MYRVLVVDDEKTICEGIVKLIEWEQYGFTVVGKAFDGQEALDMIDKENYDLIITDIRMPRVDGLELLKCLNERGYLGKYIILSAYPDFEYARKAMGYGTLGYLLKPINETSLVDILKIIGQKLSMRKLEPETKCIYGTIHESKQSLALHEICKYIGENYYKELTLSSIANHFHMNSAYLGRLFKRDVGMSFIDYVNNMRIKKAQELLLNRNLYIYEICNRVGYKDLNYFYKIFKLKTGETPIHFQESR